MCRGQRPQVPCRHGRSVDGLKRPRGRAPRRPYRSSCRRILMGPRTQIRLGAPHARAAHHDRGGEVVGVR